MAGVCTGDLELRLPPFSDSASPLTVSGREKTLQKEGVPRGARSGLPQSLWRRDQLAELGAVGRRQGSFRASLPVVLGSRVPTCTGGRGRRKLGTSPHMPGFGYYQVGALSWGPWAWYPHS